MQQENTGNKESYKQIVNRKMNNSEILLYITALFPMLIISYFYYKLFSSYFIF